MTMKILTLGGALALAAGMPLLSQAQVSLATPAATYTQSFDSLATSGTAVTWANDSTLAGWSLFTGAGNAISTYAANNGSSNTGAFVSYGSTGSGERALGVLASGGAYFGSPATGAVAGYIALALVNNSSLAFDSFTLSFDGEQWRNGGNTAAQSLTLQYGLGASFGTVASWQAAPAGFTFTSPVATATAAAVDGNAAGLLAGLGGTVSLDWAPGQTLWLRWADLNDAGNDHGLAIDNVSFSVTAVPEPGTTALWLAGLAALGLLARRRA
jgi:MYXO-CTERM domain-containing protein